MAENYDLRFAWESPYGHVVRLLEEHGAKGGAVLDLGCGYGAVAEPLRSVGFDYVGCDVDEGGLSALRDRGLEAHQLDLADLGTVAARILKIVDGRHVAAIVMLDTMEHLPDPAGFLRELRGVSVELDGPLLALSIPNVGHYDVGAKLLTGQWDVRPTGLLDATHLQFFNEGRLTDVLRDAGWYQIAQHDFSLHHSDQHFPPDHPALRDGTPLREFLWQLRRRSAAGATVNQFVRVFALVADSKPHRPEAGEETAPFLSVLMRTQGKRMANLLEALTCLAAQTDQDFETLLLVHSPDLEVGRTVRELVGRFAPQFSARVRVHQLADGGRARPLNLGLERAAGRYVVMLDDDDLVTADWVQRFHEGADDAPGRVIRSITADRRAVRLEADEARAAYLALGPLEMNHAATYDPIEHLFCNRTPNCSFAVPRTAVEVTGIRFDESLEVLEDWSFLLNVAAVSGVHDTGHLTSVYHRWEGAESSLGHVSSAVWDTTRSFVLQQLDAAPLLLPPGTATRVAELWADSLSLQATAEALHDVESKARRAEQSEQGLRADLDGYRQEVEAYRADLERTVLALAKTRAALAEAEARLSGCDHLVSTAVGDAEALRSSTSWRMTAPFRRVAALLHSLAGRR